MLNVFRCQSKVSFCFCQTNHHKTSSYSQLLGDVLWKASEWRQKRVFHHNSKLVIATTQRAAMHAIGRCLTVSLKHLLDRVSVRPSPSSLPPTQINAVHIAAPQ